MLSLSSRQVIACRINRVRIHGWLDRPGQPMPARLVAHLGACSSCRRLVQRWNGLELDLQALRDDAPMLRRTLAPGRAARCCRSPAGPRPTSSRLGRLAACTLVAALLIAGCLAAYMGVPRKTSGEALALVSGRSRGGYLPAAEGLRPDLSLANTR